MIVMMRLLVLLSPWALSLCDGFETPSVLSRKVPLTSQSPSSSSSKLMVASPGPSTSSGGSRSGIIGSILNRDNEEEDECIVAPPGPASVFGRPISDDNKEWNRMFIHTCKSILFDTLFRGNEVTRCYARFYALENIARMPYFSYLSVLHLYESLGWWRRAEYLKVHFSEAWNEQHHLLIMEEIGGNDQWRDRFVAQHVAVFYYWMVIALYMYNPTLAYNLNQAVEEEAYTTYSNFVRDNKAYLQSQPAPQAAKKYYTGEDLYLFDAMHFDNEQQQEEGAMSTKQKKAKRRPKMETLFDAFSAVRDDEMEHVKTMSYLQEDACIAYE